MTHVTHRELMPGVRLTAVQTDKFKTNLLSVSLLAPISEETASANALFPYVLRRGTERCPDMETLSAALDELYGGSIEPMVRKKERLKRWDLPPALWTTPLPPEIPGFWSPLQVCLEMCCSGPPSAEAGSWRSM